MAELGSFTVNEGLRCFSSQNIPIKSGWKGLYWEFPRKYWRQLNVD